MRSSQVWALSWIIVGAALLCSRPAMASTHPAVAELFTSTACSSCPPADAIAGYLTRDPRVLVLSFHVNYWDSPQWRDPFAMQASTDRQFAYSHAMHARGVATPQFIVNGVESVVGAQWSDIREALAKGKQFVYPAEVDLSKRPDGSFVVGLAGSATGADVWEVRYVRKAVTVVRGGENRGRTLKTYNNVTQIRRVETFSVGTLALPPLRAPDDGLAVIVQRPDAGRIVGASMYQ